MLRPPVPTGTQGQGTIDSACKLQKGRRQVPTTFCCHLPALQTLALPALVADTGTHSQPRAVFSSQIQSAKKIFRHLYGDLNLDEIKYALHSLTVNRETNLTNLIRPQLGAKLLQ